MKRKLCNAHIRKKDKWKESFINPPVTETQMKESYLQRYTLLDRNTNEKKCLRIVLERNAQRFFICSGNFFNCLS